MKQLAGKYVTLQILTQTVTVPTDTVMSWNLNDNGQDTVYRLAVTHYVSALSTQYSTIQKTRTLHSTTTGTVSVPAGTVGWSINVSANTAMIVASVQAGQDRLKEIVQHGSG